MAIIKGGAGADNKIGTAAADQIYGYAGADKLYGRGGNDSIWGDVGNDTLYGEDGDDSIYGGADNDIVYGGIGNDKIYGDAGTDTLRGDAGNDVIKGGTGIGYLYGGDGNDQIYYDPSYSNLAQVKDYLSVSRLDGGAGTDTAFVYNNMTYTAGGTEKAARTFLAVGEMNNGEGIVYANGPGTSVSHKIANFTSMEKIQVVGKGGLDFYGGTYDRVGTDITGTAADDTFHSSTATDRMTGGAGNDKFYFDGNGGVDRVFSETNDADSFYLNAGNVDGHTVVTGFNGAGTVGGDKIFIDKGWDTTATVRYDVFEYDGVQSEVIVWTEGGYDGGHTSMILTIDKVGLKEGVDIFWV